MQGLVKFFNAERGFGFVHNEAGSWWFHRSYCRGDPPAAGDTVEFWLDDGTRGDLVAVDVTVCAHRFHCLIPTARRDGKAPRRRPQGIPPPTP
jgi:cold shock CspA family protein